MRARFHAGARRLVELDAGDASVVRVTDCNGAACVIKCGRFYPHRSPGVFDATGRPLALRILDKAEWNPVYGVVDVFRELVRGSVLVSNGSLL